MNIRSGIKSALWLVCCFYALSAYAADTIHGTVRNQTTGKAAADDEVILLRLQNGMEEEGKARTDAQGAFALSIVSNAPHVVRVVHQGVNYDQTVTSASLQIGVFDAVEAIPELSGRLGIVKVESDGEVLKVTQMYSIDNESTPPVTQASPRNFEFFLPSGAKLDLFQARKAGAIWVNLAPVPVPARKGVFAVDFPMRPGETLFKFTYRLPYAGRASLHVRLPYPIQHLAVVHPASISFKALRPGSFTGSGEVQGMRLELPANQPVKGEVPAFEISGAGTAPEPALPGQASRQAAPTFSALAENSRTQPAATGDAAAPAADAAHLQSKSQLWLVLAGIVAILSAMIAGWRAKKIRLAGGASSGKQSLIETLKEELNRLELEKLQGLISPEQYDSTRQALNLSLKRASARSEH
ncbi:MAG TPA: carboxypeptidase-like regulatory domain-containing protein [Candidatus Angelobacter sp.]|nr:carboxypeptidase-like regulatory domain-containing protein [Candidatus Angelobacter sp.]